MNKTCSICKSKFEKHIGMSVKDWKKTKFCSLKCFGISISKIIRTICSNCGNPIIRRPHRIKRNKDNFCSSECYHIFASKYHKEKNGHNFKTGHSLKKYYCLDCKKEITWQCGVNGSGFCKSCFQKGNRSHAFINGESYLPYTSEFTKKLREKIRIRDGNKCVFCGMTKKEHYKKYNRNLEVHHKDHNKQNCKEDNLETRCKQCNINDNQKILGEKNGKQ
jgi:hypothetical protein